MSDNPIAKNEGMPKEEFEQTMKLINDIKSLKAKNEKCFETGAGKAYMEKLTQHVEAYDKEKIEAATQRASFDKKIGELQESVKALNRRGMTTEKPKSEITTGGAFFKEMRFRGLRYAASEISPAAARQVNKFKLNDVEKERLNRYSEYFRKDMAGHPDAMDERTKELVGQTIDPGYAGLLAVPPDLMRDFLETDVLEFSPMRELARVSTLVGYKAIEFLRKGRLQGFWAYEGGTRQKGTPQTYDFTEVPVHERAVILPLHWEALDQLWFDLEADFRRQVGEAFGVLESEAFINGAGGHTPIGILQPFLDDKAGYIPTGATDGIASANNLAAMITKKDSLDTEWKDAYHNRATWLMRRSTLFHIITLVTEGGGDYLSGTFHFTFDPTTRNIFLEGLPARFDPYMPELSSGNYPIILADFQTSYQIVDKVAAITSIRDIYSAKEQGIIEWLFRSYVGGQPTGVYEGMRAMKAVAESV